MAPFPGLGPGLHTEEAGSLVHQTPAGCPCDVISTRALASPSMVDGSWPLSQNEPVPSSVTSRVFVTAARHSEAGVFLANTVSLQFAVECFHFSCLGLLLPLLN